MDTEINAMARTDAQYFPVCYRYHKKWKQPKMWAPSADMYTAICPVTRVLSARSKLDQTTTSLCLQSVLEPPDAPEPAARKHTYAICVMVRNYIDVR